MKKQLFKTVFAAVFVWMVCAAGVLAQTWTGNAPQAGDYYLYNVGAKKFLTSGCWWGTHAAMDDDGMLLKLAGSGNAYTISTAVAFSGKYLGDNAYMDNGTAATWTFTQVGATNKYTMKNGDNYLVYVSGAVADNTTTAPTTDAGYWQIVSRADLINNMKSATPSSPVDASFFMTNPKIRRNWSNSKPFSGEGFSDNGSFNANDYTLYGGGCTSVGQYRKTFDNYQALTGLPNGKYQITVKGHYRNDGGGYAIPYMYANDQKTNLKLLTDNSVNNAEKATKSLVDDTYLTDAVTVTITDGNMRVGVKSDANVDWCTWREFTIKFLDPQLSFAAEPLLSTTVTADKWYAVTIPSNGNYTLSSSASATITYTQDGTQLVSNVTSTSSQSIDANGSKNLALNAGSLYVKANTATTITVEVASYVFTAGQDITSIITNPGFEDNAAVVSLSSSNLTGVTGWTLLSAENTNDVGTRAYSENTFATLNGEGDYCFNSYWEGKPLTQTLDLPAGTYELSALVTTGNASSTGTVYLNAGNVHSTGFARKSPNANYYYRERLVFSITEEQNVTIGIRGGENVASGAKKGAWVENGYWWYKCDDFKLKYLCEPTQANLYSQLHTLVTNCAPWTSGDEYSTNYTTYSNYSSSNSIAELTAAISYLTNEYERYVLENATTSHPYDLGLIKNADYANGQTDWSTALNQTGGGNYSVTSDGTQTNFFQSTYNTHMRHSSIYQEGIIIDEGIYRLSAKMKGTPKDDESTYIYATTGAVDHWGSTLFAGDTYYGYLTTDVASSWSTVNAYITLDAPATVRVGVLSWGNNWSGGNGGAFSVDDWKLEKISYAVVPKKGVVSAYGPAPLSDINTALTSDIGAVDLRKATGLSSAEITTTNNPNLLIYANSGQVSNSNNVVVDGQCSSLILTDSHPFINPTQFTATSASYTMSAVASGKNANDENISFGTLVIPYAASLPSGGKAYTLDADINLIEGKLRGTEVSSIDANSPVLVTAAGDYTGSNVTVPVVAQGATYTNGQLVGTYSPMTAVEGSYVLQNHTSGEGVAFYLVGSSNKPTVNPFRAYIKPQGSNARALKVVFDDAQGISTTLNDNGQMTNDIVYDLQGRRVAQPTKGLYIVNGRKTVIK